MLKEGRGNEHFTIGDVRSRKRFGERVRIAVVKTQESLMGMNILVDTEKKEKSFSNV